MQSFSFLQKIRTLHISSLILILSRHNLHRSHGTLEPVSCVDHPPREEEENDDKHAHWGVIESTRGDGVGEGQLEDDARV